MIFLLTADKSFCGGHWIPLHLHPGVQPWMSACIHWSVWPGSYLKNHSSKTVLKCVYFLKWILRRSVECDVGITLVHGQVIIRDGTVQTQTTQCASDENLFSFTMLSLYSIAFTKKEKKFQLFTTVKKQCPMLLNNLSINQSGCWMKLYVFNEKLFDCWHHIML